MWKFSIDIAERNGALLRRLLCSAERFSERAMARGLRFVKTPCSRSSALLVRMTRADQRLECRAMSGCSKLRSQRANAALSRIARLEAGRDPRP